MLGGFLWGKEKEKKRKRERRKERRRERRKEWKKEKSKYGKFSKNFLLYSKED